jgi:hypothetical protein
VPNGTLKILTEEKGAPIAEIAINDSQSWKNALTCVNISGKCALYFKYEGEGAIDVIEVFFE